MIKRLPNLSIESGGSVSRRGRNGKKAKLGSHCRLFQTQPIHHKTMLCVGFDSYPPCPDLEVCRTLQKAKKVRPKIQVIPESLALE